MALSVLHPAPVSTTSRLQQQCLRLCIWAWQPHQLGPERLQVVIREELLHETSDHNQHLLLVTRSTKLASCSCVIGGMAGAVDGRYAGLLVCWRAALRAAVRLPEMREPSLAMRSCRL